MKNWRMENQDRDPDMKKKLGYDIFAILSSVNVSQRYHNNSQMNNIVHSSFPKREKKGKGGKKKRLTKADIGTPSNFQWVFAGTSANFLQSSNCHLKNLSFFLANSDKMFVSTDIWSNMNKALVLPLSIIVSPIVISWTSRYKDRLKICMYIWTCSPAALVCRSLSSLWTCCPHESSVHLAHIIAVKSGWVINPCCLYSESILLMCSVAANAGNSVRCFQE